jgi:hypothetical protein
MVCGILVNIKNIVFSPHSSIHKGSSLLDSIVNILILCSYFLCY